MIDNLYENETGGSTLATGGLYGDLLLVTLQLEWVSHGPDPQGGEYVLLTLQWDTENTGATKTIKIINEGDFAWSAAETTLIIRLRKEQNLSWGVSDFSTDVSYRVRAIVQKLAHPESL